MVPKLVAEIHQLKGRVGRLESARFNDCNRCTATINKKQEDEPAQQQQGHYLIHFMLNKFVLKIIGI